MTSGSQTLTESLRHVYLSQIPDFLHAYIDDIVYVDKDENRGFRVI